MPQSDCFIIQLPRRVLRVYWLGYLPGSVFRECVSGASSLVCTGLKEGSYDLTRPANMSLTTWSWRWCMISFLLFSSACNSSFSRIRVSRSSCIASRSHCKRSHSCLKLSRSCCKSSFSCYKKKQREKTWTPLCLTITTFVSSLAWRLEECVTTLRVKAYPRKVTKFLTSMKFLTFFNNS